MQFIVPIILLYKFSASTGQEEIVWSTGWNILRQSHATLHHHGPITWHVTSSWTNHMTRYIIMDQSHRARSDCMKHGLEHITPITCHITSSWTNHMAHYIIMDQSHRARNDCMKHVLEHHTSLPCQNNIWRDLVRLSQTAHVSWLVENDVLRLAIGRK